MSEEIKVRIEWAEDDQAAAFVNHLIASFDGAVYTLRFYQVLPPALLAIDPSAARQIESVPGRPVATMVVTPDTLANLVDVLHGILERKATESKE
jgi:hypothetical protein